MLLMVIGMCFVLWAKGKENYLDQFIVMDSDFDVKKPLLTMLNFWYLLPCQVLRPVVIEGRRKTKLVEMKENVLSVMNLLDESNWFSYELVLYMEKYDKAA